MKILVVGDPHGKINRKVPKNVDFVLILGDLGKADLARQFFFENIKRQKKGLPKIEEGKDFIKKTSMEIYTSSVNVAKFYSSIAPAYSIKGNVGADNKDIKENNKKFELNLPLLWDNLKKVNNFNLVSNGIRNINGLRVGFLDYFLDECWVREFISEDKERLGLARKETKKSKRILKWFGKNKIDILVCHQPPYGILDKVSKKYGAPRKWEGKHAGSKIILDFVKKNKKLKYVFCGHIHEGKGKAKIGKTEIINAGVSGDYFVVDLSQ